MFFQTLKAPKRASCELSSVALKTTGCDVWELEHQASNVAASVQSSALIHVSSVFDTNESIVHHTVLKFSPCHNNPLLQDSTCPY